MSDSGTREAGSVEAIEVSAGKINRDLIQTIQELQSIALQIRHAAEHAHVGQDDRTIALQQTVLALQQHAVRLRDMVDPVRSVLRPERLYHAGIVAAADERFEIAAGLFRRALELRPDFSEAREKLEEVVLRQSELAQQLRYICPLCRSHFSRFLPFGLKVPVLVERQVVGGGYRANARCPVCGSLDRERLLYLYLLHKTDIFGKYCKLLHVAPEGQIHRILHSQANVDYLTADLLSPNVMTRMDISDIAFGDNVFDAIICNHVLEHTIDDRKAMAELFRVLKPGGWAILQVPVSPALVQTYEDSSIIAPADRESAFGQHNHVRIYGTDYPTRLAQTGFTVDIFDWRCESGHFGGAKNRFGLNEGELVFIARKPK